MAAVSYQNDVVLKLPKYERKPAMSKELAGVDVFVHWRGENVADLAESAKKFSREGLSLTMITNRGIKVWPDGFSETFCTDHWRCRYKPKEGNKIEKGDIIEIMQAALGEGIDVVKTENLYYFDGKPAFSLGQGQ